MNKDSQTIDISNVRWFHPGLGKTQSKIMDILENKAKTWGWIPIYNLTAKVYWSELCGDIMWDGNEYPITKSQLNSVRRAVKALEKRGLVKTMIIPVGTPKGIRYMKVVGILSDKYGEEK
jgi:hypothetical protein